MARLSPGFAVGLTYTVKCYSPKLPISLLQPSLVLCAPLAFTQRRRRGFANAARRERHAARMQHHATAVTGGILLAIVTPNEAEIPTGP